VTRVDLYIHLGGEPDTGQVDEILALLRELQPRLAGLEAKGVEIMADLTEITAATQANTDAAAAAVDLLNRLADLVDAAASDPAALAALTADIRANSKSLGDAVTANTPAG